MRGSRQKRNAANPNAENPYLVEAHRELVRRQGLHGFVRLAWSQVEPSPFVDGKHIGLVCAHLEAVARCEIRNLIINIPPGFMKSLLVGVFFPVWAWATVDPALKWMFASFDPRLSLRDAIRAKELITSDWFVQRWGDNVTLYKGERSEAGSEYYTNARGLRFSTSVAGKAVGWHSDIQVVDDPIKPRDTKGGSEATGIKLEEAREWWQSTMASRKANPATFRRIIVQQRVHGEDLTGVCKDSGDYVHLCLPMEYDPSRHCKTIIGEDWRKTEGELLWPERVGPNEVADLKHPTKGLGEWDYEAQAQQNILPKSGGIFKDALFPTYSLEELLKTPGLGWLQSWDMRFIDSKTRGDFVVGGVWATMGARYYLVQLYRGRWGFNETLDKVRQATIDWPMAVTKLVEAKANGIAIVEVLENEVPGLLLVEPDGGKEARATACAPMFEAGNVWFPEGAAWLDEYKHEILHFPRLRHDDQVDMTSQALNHLRGASCELLLKAMNQVFK